MKITNVYALRRLYDDLIVPDLHDLPDGNLFRKKQSPFIMGVMEFIRDLTQNHKSLKISLMP